MFKSIRTRLTLSYIVLILVSLAVTGFFFQTLIISKLEKNLTTEMFNSGNITAGTMSSLLAKHENFLELSEKLSEQYSTDGKKNFQVYISKGFLVADSGEENIGRLEAPEEILGRITGTDKEYEEISVRWQKKLRDNRNVFHLTISLFDFEGKFLGAVDTSIIGDKDNPLPDAETQHKMFNTGDKIANDLYFANTDHWDESARRLTARFSPDAEYRVRVYNKNLVLSASNQTLDPARNNRLFDGESLSWIRDDKPERLMNVAVPIIDRDTKLSLGSVVLSSSLADIDNTYYEIRRVFAYSAALSIFVTVIISLFLAVKLIRPITQIRDVTSGIAAGNFSTRVNYKGRDEIRSLADTINFMAGCVESSFREITDEKDKMNALLGALPDGVIALAYSGEIRFINESSEKYLKVSQDDIKGRTLFEIWPEKEIREFFEEGRDKNALFTEEVSIASRFLRLYLIPYGENEKNNSGMMMIIRDVTDLRRLEETRTRFLGSISHELRTPLTIIKGFIHTVIDDEVVRNNEDVKRAFEVIENEADRLTRLVNDLLELSRLRSKRLSIEMDYLIPDELVSDTVTQILPNAERMTIDLKVTTGSEGINLKADRDRLKQVILNVVDNAIKYTPGGGKISVNTLKNDDFWVFSVEDTGMGIPKSEIPFLFERFFRTKDKNKKKFISGTGLGMAIVKEIVDAHQGKIEVDSVEGEGTKISIFIPLEAEPLKVEEPVIPEE
jgi:PAS domain S-box-containing protein